MPREGTGDGRGARSCRCSGGTAKRGEIRGVLMVFIGLLTLPGCSSWSTTAEMVQAQYLLVGRYMEHHFVRAAKMNDAVKSEYDYVLRLRGQGHANNVLQAKGTYGYDLSTIINNYLKKAKDFFEDGHPQTGVAVLMELSKFSVPTDPGSLRCCTYEEAMVHLFNFWKRVLIPQGVLSSYSVARKHIRDLEASGVDTMVLLGRLKKVRDALAPYGNTEVAGNLADVAASADDLMATIQRLRQYRD